MQFNHEMLVVTTNDIPGRQILSVKGIVHGIIVRTPTISQGFLGSLKNIGSFEFCVGKSKSSAHPLLNRLKP